MRKGERGVVRGVPLALWRGHRYTEVQRWSPVGWSLQSLLWPSFRSGSSCLTGDGKSKGSARGRNPLGEAGVSVALHPAEVTVLPVGSEVTASRKNDPGSRARIVPSSFPQDSRRFRGQGRPRSWHDRPCRTDEPPGDLHEPLQSGSRGRANLAAARRLAGSVSNHFGRLGDLERNRIRSIWYVASDDALGVDRVRRLSVS